MSVLFVSNIKKLFDMVTLHCALSLSLSLSLSSTNQNSTYDSTTSSSLENLWHAIFRHELHFTGLGISEFLELAEGAALKEGTTQWGPDVEVEEQEQLKII